MDEPINGFDFLKEIRRQKEGKRPTYSELEDFLKMKAREKGVPVSGQFELTPLCNFNCKMCYVHLMKDQLGTTEILSVEQWKDLMYQAWQAGMFQ